MTRSPTEKNRATEKRTPPPHDKRDKKGTPPVISPDPSPSVAVAAAATATVAVAAAATATSVASKRDPPTQIPPSPELPKVKKEKSSDERTTDNESQEAKKAPGDEKQLFITDYMKPRAEIGTVDLTADPKVTLSIRQVAKGYIHLVSINKMPGGPGKLQEMNLIAEAIKKTGRIEREFMCNSGLVAVCIRRKTKALNEPVRLRCTVWNKTYDDKYFVVVMEPHQSKESVLVAFQRYLTQKGVDVGIKYPFEMTSNKRQSLDHYLLDETILKIIRMTWATPVDQTFYKTNTVSLVQAFYSHPYPAIASAELGFPQKKDYYFTEDDLVHTDTEEV